MTTAPETAGLLAELKRRKVVRAGLVYGAAGRSDRAAFESIVQEMRGSPDPFLPIAVWSVAVFGQDLAGAEEAARLMTDNDRPSLVRGAGHFQLAYLALAQGRYKEALAQLDSARELGDPDAELLMASGRQQEALGWYQGLREHHSRTGLHRTCITTGGCHPPRGRP